MSAPKLGFEDSLREVVSAGKCAGCAACVIVCPFATLEYHEESPKLVKECESCGICSRVCPRLEPSWGTLEKLVFGREKSPQELFGIYRRIVAAKSTDENVLRVCQDGGVVTALLTFGLGKGTIDAAAVSGLSGEKPFYPVPKLATGAREVLECAGTRYSYSPNLLSFKEGVEQKRESIAFVGVPCQVHALRKIQAACLRKYTDPLGFIIGLMCTESFTYEGLMEEKIQNSLGIALGDVRKVNIKGKVLVTTKSGEVKTIPLKEAKRFARKGCAPCSDFSAELADISVGGLGLEGWTLCVIRTEVGESLFGNAEEAGALETRPIGEKELAFTLLRKLSGIKSQRRSREGC
jgi:coenzyme F420 hydrogenase subunit beta